MLKKESELKNRSHYLEKLIEFKDTDFIKIITGIRRCGKSSLMKLMIKHLLDNGIEKNQIIQINFESMEFKRMTVEDLYNYVKSNLPKNKKAYLFFDEIQKVSEWQDAINSFRVDFECDIYITGSNAFLLSSEYTTYLAGRSIEIKVYPLSFIEFIDFHGYKIIEKKSLTGGISRKVESENGETYEIKELFDAYITFGGMPSLTELPLEIDKALTILDGIYSSVVIRDILEREKQKDTIKRNIVASEIYVDDKFLGKFKGDGVIISTPTGSTAYSLSAGGPIVTPEQKLFIITPIAPHNLNTRPIILSGDVKLVLTLSEPSQLGLVNIDGHTHKTIKLEDKVEIFYSKESLKIVIPEARNYYDVLREKLKWGENLC